MPCLLLFKYSINYRAKSRVVDQETMDIDSTNCSLFNLNGSRMHHCIYFITENWRSTKKFPAIIDSTFFPNSSCYLAVPKYSAVHKTTYISLRLPLYLRRSTDRGWLLQLVDIMIGWVVSCAEPTMNWPIRQLVQSIIVDRRVQL